MSYAPIEIKNLAIRLFKSGDYTQAAISKIVGYSVSAIKIWIARDRQSLPLSAQERGHKPRKLTDEDRLLIRKIIGQRPDATIEDVRKALNYKASKSAVHREMVELGFTFKKTGHANEQEREDVQLARMNWVDWMETCQAEHLVFVDEAAAKTNMTPLYDWSPKGERCYGKSPCNWSTTTILSSIRLDGKNEGVIFNGGVTKEIFREYIEEVLLPTLKPGDIIVMDNLRAHNADFNWRKFKRRKAGIRRLPPYSPDFNPIEMMWSVVKSRLRRVSPQDDLSMWREVSYAHFDVTPEMAHNWFENIGYVH